METIYDKKGIPIEVGDLLKTFHCVGPRRKKYYVYHVVIEKHGKLPWLTTLLTGIDKSHPEYESRYFCFPIRQDTVLESEVIYGPYRTDPDADLIAYDERPRRPLPQSEPVCVG